MFNCNRNSQSSQNYLKIERLVTCLSTTAYVYGTCAVRVTILVLMVNSNQFQILRSYTLYSGRSFLRALDYKQIIVLVHAKDVA